MIEVFRNTADQTSCLISYMFLLYGALLTVVGFFSFEFAMGTVPTALGLAFLHLTLQVLIQRVDQQEAMWGLFTDIGLIVVGLLPGLELRKDGLLASLFSAILSAFIIVSVIYPSIVSRCGVW